MTKKQKKTRRLPLFVGLTVLGLAIMHTAVAYRVEQVIAVKTTFGSDADEDTFLATMQAFNRKLETALRGVEAPLARVAPFQEVEAFDEDAMSWSNYFNAYGSAGTLVFDANGDGRPDVYLTQAGNNWTRPTDAQGVIVDEPRYQHNGLYLNQGSNEEGQPIFKQVQDLVRANDTYVEEELLVENFLFPRKGVDDSVRKEAREATVAVAADLNGDGLPDLLVGTALPGMLWSSPKTQHIMGQFVRPVGREEFRSNVPLSAQGLFFKYDYQPRYDGDSTRTTARGVEPVAANSIFINLGDRDGDGIPEWRDATVETGLGGRNCTYALVVADFDLDGDLDVFEANAVDPDFWPGGALQRAGEPNRMFINQLKETGKLTFVERAKEMNVDGLFDEDYPEPPLWRLKRIPLIPEMYSVALMQFEPYWPGWIEIGGTEHPHGEISWAAMAQDADHDGYPDLWVANDLGYLRLFLNKEGKRFELAKNHVRHDQSGNWMSLSAGDFDGDLKEDVFAGNLGGGSMNLAFSVPDPQMIFEPVIEVATMSQQFFGTKHRALHALVDGKDFTQELPNHVRHSRVMPPDAALPNNTRQILLGQEKTPYNPDSLDPYEFAWGTASFDVQNDGRLDLYWIGCMYGRGGGIFPIAGTGPGRLLVNTTPAPGKTSFVDLTGDYQLFNILELQYDRLETDGYVYRKSPRQNWSKRSTVTSHDLSVWGLQGPSLSQHVANHDLIQASENGRSVVAADLNGDGYADLIVRNLGGYDSRRSNSTNLMAKMDGRVVVIPAHDYNFQSPTNYDPGTTRLFLNTHPKAGLKNRWLKVELIDDSADTANRAAVGAEVIVNGRYLLVRRVGDAFLSNHYGPLLFGLGEAGADTLEVRWPDRARTVTRYDLGGLANTSITVSKTAGVKPREG